MKKINVTFADGNTVPFDTDSGFAIAENGTLAFLDTATNVRRTISPYWWREVVVEAD